MTAELAGRVAMIVGGTGGIGRAVARLLLERGCAVHVSGIAHSASGEASTTVGARSALAHLDVTDERSIRESVEATCERWGGLDIVVYAAGIQRYGDAVSTSLQLWREVIDVNLTGAFLTVKHALPALRERGGGSIALVSSAQAILTQRGVVAYTASKAGLNGLARAVAVDEAPNGIRCNTVCPASVDTPMLRDAARRFTEGEVAADDLLHTWGAAHPLGRVASADEVAEVVAFLAGPRASFVTGATVPVDGGLTIATVAALPR